QRPSSVLAKSAAPTYTHVMTTPASERPRIIATRRFPPAIEAALAAEFDAVLSPDDHRMTPAELQRALGEADGILCAIGDRFTAEVLAAYPLRTRIIASFGVGLDHIDLDAACAHDIVVTNTPGVLTEDTADLRSEERRVGKERRPRRTQHHAETHR